MINAFNVIQRQELLTAQIPEGEGAVFSELEIESSLKLARVLERAHKRLVREGYTIECGKIYKKDEK
jgi:hypothetical protein